MRLISYRFRTALNTFLRIKPLDSPLIHLTRRSGMLTTEHLHIDHDHGLVAAELLQAVKKAR